jgi:hypothetical protein
MGVDMYKLGVTAMMALAFMMGIATGVALTYREIDKMYRDKLGALFNSRSVKDASKH